MAYKRYVKRGGKVCGPYYYESYRDKNGKVKKRYIGTIKPHSKKHVVPTHKKSKTNKRHKQLQLILTVTLVALILIIAFNLYNNQISNADKTQGEQETGNLFSINFLFIMEEQKLLANVVLEIVGAPKEHVDSTLNTVIEKIKEEKGIKISHQEIGNAENIEIGNVKSLFSAFVELDIEFSSVSRLLNFCFDFMPSSVEILEPEDLSLDFHKFSSFLNDLLAQLHKYDMALKNTHAKNVMLQRELEKLKGSKES